MPRRTLLALVVSLAAASASAEVAVQPKPDGRLDLRARAAPLSEVLERLARQTGMRVVYDGAAPRQLVTLTLVDRSPAEAVTAVLEGMGVNYALVGDQTGALVQTLMITGTAPAVATAARSSAAPVRPSGPPSPHGPDTSEVFDDDGDEPAEFTPAEQLPPPSQPPAMVTGDGGAQPQPPAAPGTPGAPVQENPAPPFTPPAGSMPPQATSPFSPSPFSSSPFTPQPAVPQPQFPPAQPQPQPQPQPGQGQPQQGPSTP